MKKGVRWIGLGLAALSAGGCNLMSGERRTALYQSEIDRVSAERAILDRELRNERIRRERAEAIVIADRTRPTPAETVSALRMDRTPVPPASPVAVSERPGSVLELQQALSNAGYPPGPLDGKMGAKTRDAVRKFQRDAGLKTDGVAGPKTWSVLAPYLSRAATPAGIGHGRDH